MKTVVIVKDRNNFGPLFYKYSEEHGFKAKLIDIWKKDSLDYLLEEPIDAFVWWAKHNPEIKNFARRLIYLFNNEINIPTFPDWQSYWHYDDKISQSLLFRKYDIPGADTFIFFNKDEAVEFAKNTHYPIIYKCAHGAGSANVGILKNQTSALNYIRKAFGKGLKTYFKDEIQKGYVYFQEYLEDNKGDYRLVCFGDDKIQGVFRNNRKGSVFASGSGQFDFPDLPEDMLNLVADTNKKLGFGVMSYDILKKRDQWVITEISVIFGEAVNTIYDRIPVYNKKNGIWYKENMYENLSQRLFNYLLKYRWKWI
ncbi:MAG: RimK family alpha-L-glutamate ligase [Calditrichaceae bacterium]